MVNKDVLGLHSAGLSSGFLVFFPTTIQHARLATICATAI